MTLAHFLQIKKFYFPQPQTGHFRGLVGLKAKAKGLYYRSRGLQNVFSRTWSRTPPLKKSNASQDKINIVFAQVTEKFVLFLPKSLCHRVGCFQAISHRSLFI